MEENLRRKDLTAYERSKNLVALAEKAAEVLREADETPSPVLDSNNRPAGPSVKPDSEAKVSERVGVPQQTINLAKQHVAAAEKHPC